MKIVLEMSCWFIFLYKQVGINILGSICSHCAELKSFHHTDVRVGNFTSDQEDNTKVQVK